MTFRTQRNKYLDRGYDCRKKRKENLNARTSHAKLQNQKEQKHRQSSIRSN